MTTWGKRGAGRAVIVGAIAIMGTVAVGGVGILLYLHSHRPVTNYTVAMPGADFGGGGTCYGCRPFDGIDLTDGTLGVAAKPPSDSAFRGFVVTSSVFPPGLRDARVTPDGYYLEYTDATVRFVAGDAMWKGMESWLEPEWADYFVRSGAIDSR